MKLDTGVLTMCREAAASKDAPPEIRAKAETCVACMEAVIEWNSLSSNSLNQRFENAKGNAEALISLRNRLDGSGSREKEMRKRTEDELERLMNELAPCVLRFRSSIMDANDWKDASEALAALVAFGMGSFHLDMHCFSDIAWDLQFAASSDDRLNSMTFTFRKKSRHSKGIVVFGNGMPFRKELVFVRGHWRKLFRVGRWFGHAKRLAAESFREQAAGMKKIRLAALHRAKASRPERS